MDGQKEKDKKKERIGWIRKDRIIMPTEPVKPYEPIPLRKGWSLATLPIVGTVTATLPTLPTDPSPLPIVPVKDGWLDKEKNRMDGWIIGQEGVAVVCRLPTPATYRTPCLFTSQAIILRTVPVKVGWMEKNKEPLPAYPPGPEHPSTLAEPSRPDKEKKIVSVKDKDKGQDGGMDGQVGEEGIGWRRGTGMNGTKWRGMQRKGKEIPKRNTDKSPVSIPSLSLPRANVMVRFEDVQVWHSVMQGESEGRI